MLSPASRPSVRRGRSQSPPTGHSSTVAASLSPTFGQSPNLKGLGWRVYMHGERIWLPETLLRLASQVFVYSPGDVPVYGKRECRALGAGNPSRPGSLLIIHDAFCLGRVARFVRGYAGRWSRMGVGIIDRHPFGQGGGVELGVARSSASDGSMAWISRTAASYTAS